MFDALLITFGCSWMYGVGVNYTKGMNRDEFIADKIKDFIEKSLDN